MREIINKLQEKRQEEIKQRLNEDAGFSIDLNELPDYGELYRTEDEIKLVDFICGELGSTPDTTYWASEDEFPKEYRKIDDAIGEKLEMNSHDDFRMFYSDVVIYKGYKFLWTNEEGYVCYSIARESSTSKGSKKPKKKSAKEAIKTDNPGEYIYVEGSKVPHYATSVIIKDDVTSIGKEAFKDCTELTNIHLPDSVTSIGDSAFAYCMGLESINIPNGIKKIPSHAFTDCKSLTNIKLPDSITSIGDYAFCMCDSLVNINIPNGVTSIADSAFSGCTNLLDISIPNSVTDIGTYAFDMCTSLKSIRLPESLREITYGMFYECYKLKSIVIPNNVTKISEIAFEFCKDLSKIEIPASVVEIAREAFYGCDNLKEVTLRNPNTKYEEDSFPEDTKIIKGSSNVKESHRIELAKKLLEGEGYEIIKEDDPKVAPINLSWDNYTNFGGAYPEYHAEYGDYYITVFDMREDGEGIRYEILENDEQVYISDDFKTIKSAQKDAAKRIAQISSELNEDSLDDVGTFRITVEDAETKYADKLFKMKGIEYSSPRVKGTKNYRFLYGREFGQYFGYEDEVLTILARPGDIYEIIDRESSYDA